MQNLARLGLAVRLSSMGMDTTGVAAGVVRFTSALQSLVKRSFGHAVDQERGFGLLAKAANCAKDPLTGRGSPPRWSERQAELGKAT